MNIMIYINRTNEEQFNAEENKSGLINDLLSKHYGEEPKTVVDVKKEHLPIVKYKDASVTNGVKSPHTPEQEQKIDAYFKKPVPPTYTRPEHTA